MMNTIRFNISKIATYMLFFVVSAHAFDENQLKNKTAEARGSRTESVPAGYVEPTPLAAGIKFAIPAKDADNQKHSVRKKVGVKSNNTFLPERVDDGVVEFIINKPKRKRDIKDFNYILERYFSTFF